jgi:hypothetical protein
MPPRIFTGNLEVLMPIQTAELGPHANEDQMPFWLRKLLENDGKPITVNHLTTSGKIAKVPVVDNYAKGILPVIEQLLVQDPTTAYAYLCDPSVQHISKLKHEGTLILQSAPQR